MDEKIIDKIIEKLIPLGISIAKMNEGALFIISDDCPYERLLPQKIEPFNIFDIGADKILEKVSTIDGAVVISKKGLVKDYAVQIKSDKIWNGKGTRHSAAISASFYQETTAILISQEEKKLKIIKEGKIIMQLDALEKDVQKNYKQAIRLLESIGFGTVTSLATTIVSSYSSTLATFPIAGILLAPGILIGASYYIFRRIRGD